MQRRDFKQWRPKVNSWKKNRSVRITASRFGDVLANPKTKRYRYYMDDLIDRLNGIKEIPKHTPWFDHGREMEEELLGFYEWEMQTDLEKFGCNNPKLFIHPKYDFIGCSPDAFDNGIIVEGKSHVSYTQFEKSQKAGIPSNHMPQVQGQLWIMPEKKRCNFTSYYRNGNTRLIHIHPVYPDLKYHKRLEKACLNFWNEIQRKLNG